MNYKDKVVCVVDNNMFVELAITLSKHFGKVLYYSPWEKAFPTSNDTIIGKNVKGVQRIDSPLDYLDKVDLWVFPDLYQAPLQLHLESLGKRVWGSRKGEDLELDRVDAKILMNKLGIRIGHWRSLTGSDELIEYLKHHKNVYVKISKTRGDFETLYCKNYKMIAEVLDEFIHRLGAKKNVVEFIVEDAIDDAVEVSYDGYTIDGEFPDNAMAGIEVKDRCLLIANKPYNLMPKQVVDTNNRLSGTLKSYRYRNFFANELRITKDGKAYAIDACCRMGWPPGSLLQYMIKNIADVLWFGAKGEMVEPELRGKYGCELILYSEWGEKNWLNVDVPEDIAEHVKLKNRASILGKTYTVPQNMGPSIGSIVATGKSVEDVITQCKDIAHDIEGHCLHVMNDSLEEAKEQIKKMSEYGVDLFDDTKSSELGKLLASKGNKKLSDELSEALGGK